MKRIIHHIKNIRQQPEEIRRHILHGVTAIFGIILVSLWIYSLGTNFTNTATQNKMEDSLKPLNALKSNFIGGYNSIVNPVPNSEE